MDENRGGYGCKDCLNRVKGCFFMGVRIPEDAVIDTKERKRSPWGRFSRHFIKVRSIRFCQYGLKKKMILVE